MEDEMGSEDRNSKRGWEITRRGFLKTMGSSATIAVTSGLLPVVGTALAVEAKPEEVVRGYHHGHRLVRNRSPHA
jgi:hypothetical protein